MGLDRDDHDVGPDDRLGGRAELDPVALAHGAGGRLVGLGGDDPGRIPPGVEHAGEHGLPHPADPEHRDPGVLGHGAHRPSAARAAWPMELGFRAIRRDM